MNDCRNFEKNEQRVLVISGGGSRGAWGGGVIKKLYETEQPDWRCIVGTSSGSLLAPLTAILDFEKMEEAFTSVDQKDIFNVNPFTKDGKIRMALAIWRIVRGKENLGKTDNLRKRIVHFFTPDNFKELQATGRVVKICVASLTTNAVAYQTSGSNSYNDMVDWVWASANQPIFMSTLKKDGSLWVDGGIKENVPIMEGLRFAQANEITKVDVIVNNQKEAKTVLWPKQGKNTNVIAKLLRVIDMFSDEVRLSDIAGAVLEAKVTNKCINLISMTKDEYDVSPESLLFKKETMRKLWDLGYKHNFNKEAIASISLPGNNSIFLR